MTSPKVIVIGAGPVGCLSAIALAKQGWNVEIYEGRSDMRTPGARAAAQQRSINLALSARGITALQSILGPEAAADVLKDAIPMRGRMIHDVRGRLESQKYDRHGQCINSLDRAILNETLLAHADAMPGIRIFFRHKVQAIDFDRRAMTAREQDSDHDKQVNFDLCIGADGSYSVVRRQMQRVVRMDYEQKYIPHEYIELKMPPRTDDGQDAAFQMDPHHLHIWPRSSFMLIALPNKDRSFTCTLFAPTLNFDQLAIASRDERRHWFSQQFPDALDLIGADRLLDDLEHNPRGALISIKTNPYHHKDCAILLGDAAHAMVPFYGQGLNCGLEDVRILDVLLRQAGVPAAIGDPKTWRHGMEAALSRYSHERHEDLIAICDLAMQNYTEMRHDVATPSYLFRRVVDNMLQALTTSAPSSVNVWSATSPNVESLSYTEPKRGSLTDAAFAAEPFGWLPLYTMVTFQPYLGYATAQRRARRQARTLTILEGITLIGAAAAVGWGAWAARGRLR